MSKLVRFVNHSLKDFFVSNAEDSCDSSNQFQDSSPILSLMVISWLSWFANLKSSPIVSYAMNLFTTESTLYCNATRDVLAIWAAKLLDWHWISQVYSCLMADSLEREEDLLG